MNRFLGTVFFALIACGYALAADTAAIETVDEAWMKAFSTGNVDAIANLYDDKAVLLPPAAPRVNGRAQIRDFFKNEIAGAQKAGVTMSLGGKPASGISGDMGWLSGTYTVKDKSGKVIENGKYLSVMTKKDGKWLYLRDAWNADAAPPAPAPAAPKAPAKK